MQIRIAGHANLKPVEAQFASVTAQVNALNAALARTASTPAGFNRVATAANAATRAYNSTLASSGQFRVEQIKINDAVSKNTELLKRQKLSFRETFGSKSRTMMRDIYREQLAMQRGYARVQEGLVGDGKTRMSLAIPTEVHKSWDTLNNRVGMFRARLASASAEMINWGKNTQWAGRQLMAGISFPVAAFGAAAGVMAYTVDKELTRIAKVYDTTANSTSQSVRDIMAVEAELKDLREAGMNTATDAARQYGAAVTDTLQVQAELAATGLRANELQESTTQIMRISTLGELDHATATQALISLQSTLGATTTETANAFNYMNSIENATSLSTNDFAEAIPRALAPMKEMSREGATSTEVLQNLSLLMVAMKERGIDAGEGANAIKAMMQRLYRPSAKVREEWEAIAGIDPMSFVTESGGDVMKMLPQIAEATRDLDKASRVKLLAGLFGTYQVTRMSAMLDGLSDMQEGVGQTTRVLEVNRQSMQDWSKTAERELAEQAESASGKFKRAYESLRAELASLGEPFLEVASKFLTLTSNILGFINGMPEWGKKALIFTAILAAIVGPVVMLIGLFANFAGNIGKFTTWLLKSASSFELMNKAQWAAKVSAELAERAYIKEASSVEMLTGHLLALKAASEQSAIAMSRMAGVPLPPGLAAQAANSTRQAQAVKATPQVFGLGSLGLASHQPGPMLAPAKTAAENERRVASAQQAAAAQRSAARDAHLASRSALAESKFKEQTAKHMSGMAASSAAMAASMVIMMTADSQTGQDFGKWLMLAAIGVPAVKALGEGARHVGDRMKLAAKHTYSTASNAAKSGKEMSKLTGRGRAFGSVMRGAAAGIHAMMGPIGWITLALGGAFVAWKLFSDHQKRVAAEQLKAQKALSGATENWADNAGVVVENFKKIQQASVLPGGESASKVSKQVANYQKGGALEEVGNSLKELDGQERRNFLLTQFIDLQNRLGLSSKEAGQEVRAMLMAIGISFVDADVAMNDLMSTVGKIEQGDLVKQVDALFENLNFETTDTLEASAEDYAAAWGDAFASAKTPEQAQLLFDRLRTISDDGWERITSKLTDEGKKEFARVGADSIGSFYDAINREGGSKLKIMSMNNWFKDGTSYQDILAIAAEVGTLDSALTQAFVKTQGISGDFKDIEDLLKDINILSKTWTYKDAKKEVKEIKDGLNEIEGPRLPAEFGDTLTKPAEDAALIKQNIINANLGLAQGKTYGEAYAYFMNKVSVEAKKAAEETERLKKEIHKVPNDVRIGIRIDDVKGILQQGMSGVQEEIANMIGDDFDNRMQNSIDSNTAMWDDRIEALSNKQEAATEAQQARHERQQEQLSRRQERAQEAFDSRWERRTEMVERAYDRRIKAIDKEIKAEEKAEEIRQRIFDAEQARLDRLTESANRTIDFNLALQTGDLDEAAKIRNDMDAAAQEWALADAAAGSARASERRRNRLGRRQEGLENQRERALKALKQREEDERKSLERRQEAETKAMEKRQKAEEKHLQKVQEMNAESLADQAEDAKEAYRNDWENRRDSLDRQLETFKAFVPKNMKQLEKWMKEMDITYERFGIESLDPKSKKWGKWFKKSLKDNIRDAGLDIGSSNMWETMGGRIAKKTLRGMGFGGFRSFEKFLATGELPSNFGESRKPKPRGGGGGADTGRRPETLSGANNFGPTLHKGGYVDDGTGSGRKGVARTLKGLHSSEKLVRAQKGEFMVNREATKRFGPQLEAMNNGVFDPGVLGGAGVGYAGLIASALGRMFSVGVAKSLQNAYSKRITMDAPGLGSFGNIKAGAYGDVDFTAEQLKNAKIIADVGRSLGASSRDIIIALMTAMQESTLRNLDYGDRDSVGLFQQRDAWGSFAARTDPALAAKMFFTGGAQGQRGLFDFSDRNNMSLTEAAQAVQVSAYPDAYAKWANEAKAIFGALRSAGTSGEFVLGPGGTHAPLNRPWSSSYRIHGTPDAIDMSIPTGRNVYATGDGKVVTSTDIVGYEPRAEHGGNGYKSYGRYIVIQHDTGASTLYAHLSERFAREGQRVTGGSIIGKSGNTGYSLGPHLHFGATNGPLAWLKTGGMTLNDGIAMLHRGETVLTKPLTDDLKTTVQAFGKASRDELSGRNRRRRGIDRSEANMWGPETTRVDKQKGAFWSWLNTAPLSVGKTIKKVQNAVARVGDSGAAATVKIGTLNTKKGIAAAKTNADLARLIGRVDLLALTEMHSKFAAVGKWLRKQGWGLLGGKGRDQHSAAVAFNKEKYELLKSGTRKLGDKMADFIGGREKRYANYGLFRDKDSGRKLWMTSAHTVPTPNMNPAHRALFTEQWGALDKLVKELRGTGAPVFVGGDLNNNPNRNWWRTPGGLKAYQGQGVDWIFSDPELVKALGKSLVRGMHTDHAGAILSHYNIPSHKNGAENIRWDNTLVNMHKKESILTAEQSDKFRRLANNIDNVASGGNITYDVDVNVTEPSADANQIARVVIREIKKEEARKPQSRKG